VGLRRAILVSPSRERGAQKRLQRPRFRSWEHHDTVAAGRCHLWNKAPGVVGKTHPHRLNTKGPATVPAFCVSHGNRSRCRLSTRSSLRLSVAQPLGYFCPASGIARSPPVHVPGSCAPLEPYRRRVDYRVKRSSVIRGIGPRVSPIIPITVGRSRRERLAPRTFRLRRASARSHVGSRSTPLAPGDGDRRAGSLRWRRTPNDGSPHA